MTEASSRFHLSKFRLTDVDEITRLLQAPAVLEHLAQIPLNYTRADALSYFEYLQKLEENCPEIASLKFTIRENDTDKAVGRIDLEPESEGWSLGYWLGREYWGKGIMSWACKEILEISRKRGIKKIFANPKCDNWASRKVLEKNGFKLIKTEQKYFPAHGRSFECCIMEVCLE